MLRSSSNLEFSRKVVSYYLLFCLAAVCLLAAGMILTSHAISGSRTTNACLIRLGKTAASLNLAYLRGGPEQLQPTLQKFQWPAEIAYAEVVSYEGKVLAHTNPSLLGLPAFEPQGSRLEWGEVSGTQYENQQHQMIHEYRVPLVAEKEHVGTLRIAVQQLNFWSNLHALAIAMPGVILLPLVLIATGALLLSRVSQPLGQVESQLRIAALQRPTAALSLQPLTANHAIAIGWNRVVAAAQGASSTGPSAGLQDRLAEVVANREQNQLQNVLHNLPEGFAVTDLEGRITFANRAVTALLGTETESEDLAGIELEGQILEAIGTATGHRLFAETGAQQPAITEIARSAGTGERTLRVARLPLSESPGHVWSVRDVTQQKLAEQSRDQFIDAATHEMRTPLSNIKAYAETLATCDSIEIEQQRDFCNIINSEVTRLARFVDDLLSISSMEAGSLVIQRQHCVASRLFEEVLSKVQPLMRQKEIDFNVELPEKMADLEIDKDKIVAVVVNLLGNAAKYTPTQGQVLLRVKMDESQLQIAVEDTGVGISEDELPQVFDKFFRSDDPRVQAETGTGLGLSLAREVTRLHGGDITLKSKINQGTTFTATLPIR